MNSINDVWDQILEVLKTKLTSTAITTWFSDCVPIDIKESTLILHTSSSYKRDMIVSRFSNEIKETLTDIFSAPFDIKVLAGDELQDYQEENVNDTMPAEMAGYTFNQFIVGNSNKFAHAAAIAVSENPGNKFNPLFIYGASGLGKTHLLLAIGHALHDKNPSLNIVYIKGDEFTNQLVFSIQNNKTDEFRMKYRSADLFLIDDIQFIAGKQRTQEEFFHTFNEIYEAGHQIVITSDRPPMEMQSLEDRLRTRFEGGLMADIQPPDLETRMAIIKNKAAQFGLILSEPAVTYIAENITSNIRQIEGVIKRLTAYREILDQEIDIDSVKRAIQDVIRIGTFIPSPKFIIKETAKYYNISEEEVCGQNRSRNVANARQISMYLIRTLTNYSLVDIGNFYEGRTHATVLNSINKVEALIKEDKTVAATIKDITSNINNVF